jgi:hypothetical protein
MCMRLLPGHQLREVEGSLSAKKSIRLALFWGASDLNFSNTLSKLNTVASNSFSGIFGCSRVCLGKMEECSAENEERNRQGLPFL